MIQKELFVNSETEKKIDRLMQQMTLEEKIGQLHQVGPSPVGGFEITLQEKQKMLEQGKITKEEYDRFFLNSKWDKEEDNIRKGRIGSFLGIHGAEKCNHLQRVAVEQSRLGIPLLFGLDVVHGFRTVFPIPLAESCSWDEEMFEQTARISAVEATAAGLNWTFAPMIDIARDARWGRIAEGAGEDPYLTARFAAAKVRGFQGEDFSSPDTIVACAKHFIAYGAAIGGRDYNSADMSLRTLWEIYMPPFIAACKAGVATFMASFNDLNGVPCTVNTWLLQDVLRDKLGFEGFVVSDAGAIWECIEHGVVADRKDAALKALNAGMAVDMVSHCYSEHLADLVAEGKVSMERLDIAVRQVLRVKFAKGLFEHPYVDATKEKEILICQKHRDIAREAARGSAVLLKNNGILPLGEEQRIAVVGELADNAKEMLGTWAGRSRAEETVSLLEGLRRRGLTVSYAPCCSVNTPFDKKQLEEVLADADVVIAAVGELADMSGEASSLSYIGLHGEQEKMIQAIKESGKPFVTVLFNGRPLAIGNVVEQSDAVLEAWHLGTEAGNAIGDILYGDYNPSGRLTTTFPNNSGECPLYYNHMSTGRPTSEVRHTCKYMDAPLKPLFPFGYGLSYTSYAYENLQIVDNGTSFEVSVAVTNTGSRAGKETVQLYVHDVLAGSVRPVRELKAFRKVFLQPGECKTVKLSVPVDSLGFYTETMEYVVEPGEFKVYVGHDSETTLCQSFFLTDR